MSCHVKYPQVNTITILRTSVYLCLRQRNFLVRRRAKYAALAVLGAAAGAFPPQGQLVAVALGGGQQVAAMARYGQQAILSVGFEVSLARRSRLICL